MPVFSLFLQVLREDNRHPFQCEHTSTDMMIPKTDRGRGESYKFILFLERGPDADVE